MAIKALSSSATVSGCYSLRLSVFRLSACAIAAPSGRICVKFDIGNFCESLSREYRFV